VRGRDVGRLGGIETRHPGESCAAPARRPGNQPGSDGGREQGRQHGNCSQTGGVPGCDAIDSGPTSSSRSPHASIDRLGWGTRPSELGVTATSLHTIPPAGLFPTTSVWKHQPRKHRCSEYKPIRAAPPYLPRANVWLQRARPRWRRAPQRSIRGRRLALYGTHVEHLVWE
jgi:hypothetical protein